MFFTSHPQKNGIDKLTYLFYNNNYHNNDDDDDNNLKTVVFCL